MMEPTNYFSLMKGLADKAIRCQRRFPGDFLDKRGFLICGTCAEPRQQIEMVANPCTDDPDRKTPVKFIRDCRCDRLRNEETERRMAQAVADKRIAQLKDGSMMPKLLQDASFDSFRVTKHNKRALEICKRYVDQFDVMVEKNQGLLFYGDVGTGKSYAAACIANALLMDQKPVIMTSFVRLLAEMQEKSEDSRILLDRLNRATLVVFDDLGAERGTDYALERVYSIVDQRYQAQLPTIYTTNLSLPEMDRETDLRYRRIFDRVMQCCYPVQFTGPSVRRADAGRRYEEMKGLLE